VGLVVLGEGEAGGEVLSHERLLVLGLDRGDDCTVHTLLGGDAIRIHDLLLGTLGEERLVVGLSGLVVAGEGLVGDAGHINLRHVDLHARAQRVHLVDALKGHAVDLVGAGHQEQARLELLQEHDALAAEATREEDEDAAGLDALAELGGADLLDSDGSLLVLSGVLFELFDH
jgi:hypothetical protein